MRRRCTQNLLSRRTCSPGGCRRRQAGLDHAAHHGALQPRDAACRDYQRGKRAGQHLHRCRVRRLDRARVRGRRSWHSAGSTVFAALVLTSLLFLGLVTFGRCLQIAIDDWEFSVRITRLRAAYAERFPNWLGCWPGGTDEVEVNMFAGRGRPCRRCSTSPAGSPSSAASCWRDAGRRGLWAQRIPARRAAGRGGAGTAPMLRSPVTSGPAGAASSAPAKPPVLISRPAGLLRQPRPDPSNQTARRPDVNSRNRRRRVRPDRPVADAIEACRRSRPWTRSSSLYWARRERRHPVGDFADEARQGPAEHRERSGQAGAGSATSSSGRDNLTCSEDI